MHAAYDLLSTGGPDSDGDSSVHHLAVVGKERIQDLIRQSTMCVQEILAEVRDTISKCEAEVEVSEEINVVIEPQRAVISLKRNTRFAKDKP